VGRGFRKTLPLNRSGWMASWPYDADPPEGAPSRDPALDHGSAGHLT